MSTLSQQQLMMLEQVVFMKEDVFQAAGIDSSAGLDGLGKGTTLKEFLDAFDDAALKRLETEHADQSFSLIKGREMAAIIRQLKKDPELMQVHFIEKGPEGAYCFEDSAGHAVVAFQGTSNLQEWKDNVEGAWKDDTAAQNVALNYIESLPFENVTVVGHSKGGNKAMYAAILSDKVDRCLSLDGQGFSPAFLDRYSVEVNQNAHKISNWSLDHDIVHALLIQPPGSNQAYYQGGEGLHGLDVHSPSAFYHYTTNENGETVIVDSDGVPMLYCAEEGKEIQAIHGFQSFYLQAAYYGHLSFSGEFMRRLIRYIYQLFFSSRIQKPATKQTGLSASHPAFGDRRSLAGFIVLLMEFINIIKPKPGLVVALLSAFGLREMIALFEKAIADFSRIQTIKVQAEIPPIGTFEDVVLLFHKYPGYRIVRHPLFSKFMGFFEKWLQETLGVHIDANGFRKNIEEAYQVIQLQQVNVALLHGFPFGFGKYDYSSAAYQKLKDTMNNVAGVTGVTANGWNCTYSSERWFGELGVGAFVHGIQEYNNRLESVNKDCLAQMERIFHQVWQIDEKNASSIHMCRSRLNQVRVKMRQIAGQIG